MSNNIGNIFVKGMALFAGFQTSKVLFKKFEESKKKKKKKKKSKKISPLLDDCLSDFESKMKEKGEEEYVGNGNNSGEGSNTSG